jgi:iron complex outermembrane receptor protein
MMEKVLSRSIRVICLGGLAAGMHAAYAQDTQSAPMQRVEVTGSRIRQVDLETAQPIQVMSQEQIQKSGLITVGDILNNLTSAGAPDFSKGGALTSNREAGGQYINLRNLGSNRLLVLVNGKRWTATVDGYTDMSTVPSSMIERIEVLKDGASSIYGSDAIAGVVNIILKKSMDGGNLSLYTGQNAKGDGKNKDFSLSYGAGNDKANLMFSLSHTEAGEIWAKDRTITNGSYGPNHVSDALLTGPWGRIRQVSATGAATGFNQFINHTGGYDGVGTGSASNNINNYHPNDNGDADKFNTSSQMMFSVPSKLDTIFTKGSIQLPADIRFNTTAMFSQRSSTSQIAGMPLNSLTQTKYPVYLDKNSYYNPLGNQAVGAGNGQDLFFYRRVTELPRVTENENRTVHIDANLEGDFTLAGKAWNWSTGYNHSAVTGSTLSTGNINLLNLKKALGPSFKNAAGVVQCGTAANPIALAECTPWDIVGGPSASNAAALAYVNTTGQATYGSTVNSFTADINGELYNLPAGVLGFAGGLEHREVRGYDRPGQFEQSGYSSNLAGNPTDGKYTVKEAYLELNIPVLKDVPFAKLLSFDLATRHSDYSNFGTTNNSKISFMWKPVTDLLARGTYAQGFRAPSVGDTFGGGAQTFDTFLDPCDTKLGEASRNPAVAARCATSGAGAGYRQLNAAGAPITSANGTQSTVAFLAGTGNSNLSPETAVTKTLGFVYSPSFVPGLSGSLDWYNVKVDNRIYGATATYIANQCFVQNASSFCSSIKRDPTTGQIVALSRGNINQGTLETEGVDLSLSYKLPRTQYGQFALRSDTSYVQKFRVKNSPTDEWINYAGEYFYNRVKSNAALDWSLGNWSATWTARYYSGVKDSCYSSDVECSNPGGTASWGTDYNKLGAMVYNDISVGYKTSWKGSITAGINNFLDKQPRITYNGAADSSSVDANLPLERFFYVRYNQSF